MKQRLALQQARCASRGTYEGSRSLEDMVNFVGETLSPKRQMNGRFIKYVKDRALRSLKTYSNLLDAVLVGGVPTGLINACVVKTPRDGKVILLDQGVLICLPILVRSFTALGTWYTSEPYSRDYSQLELARSILNLAAYCVSGDLHYWGEAMKTYKTYFSPSAGRFEAYPSLARARIEHIILLHEYGHIVLGHTDHCETMALQFNSTTSVPAYNTSQDQEFEADKFAFECLTKDEKPETCAFDFGLLLNFFGLCEALAPPIIEETQRSHPSSRARWERIKQLANVADDTSSLAFLLDLIFDAIYHVAGLEMPYHILRDGT